MSSNRKDGADLLAFAKAILALDQPDVTRAAESVLGALLNGGSALRYLRMYPDLSSDAVHDALRSTPLRRKKGKNNV